MNGVDKKVDKFISIPLVLPRDLIENNGELKIISLAHPRTKRPTQYLYNGTKVLELTEIDGSNEHNTRSITVQASHTARSILLAGSDQIISDSRVLVATPINTLLLILPTLYSNKTRHLTSEYIEEFSETNGCDSLPKSLYENNLELICDILTDDGETSFRLSIEKLILFINNRITKILENLPSGLYKQYVNDPLTPIDINEQDKIPLELIDLAKKRLAIDLLSSYLNDEIRKLFIEKSGLDFTKLDSYIKDIGEARVKATEAQKALLQSLDTGRSGKRKGSSVGLPERKAPTKKNTNVKARSLQKTDTSKNRSLKDMFARKST